jgi:hypothetical protein
LSSVVITYYRTLNSETAGYIELKIFMVILETRKHQFVLVSQIQQKMGHGFCTSGFEPEDRFSKSYGAATWQIRRERTFLTGCDQQSIQHWIILGYER